MREPLDDAAEAVQAWTVELDRLEVEILWAERVLKVMAPLDPTGWAPRDDLCPLPANLRSRARELRERQLWVSEQLASEMKQLLRKRQFADNSPARAGVRLDFVG